MPEPEPDIDFGTEYKSEPALRKYDCSCHKFNHSGINKNGNRFSGNAGNRPGFLITNSFLMSTQIRTANYQRGTKISFANKSLNSFGRWAGAPGGSGRPPRNFFV